jgi:hypothetical protein
MASVGCFLPSRQRELSFVGDQLTLEADFHLARLVYLAPPRALRPR